MATILLGCIIFIDDYFNCLTVGSVMLPVTDKHRISREKLAYLIDATAAPVCIIAPISSWAAAVTSSVDGVVNSFANNNAVMSLIPAVVFVIGCVISFATGTSWGTFGILIPIVVKVFNYDVTNTLMIISVSACMAGAVCGDHCSPISDTTIMASAGARCVHINHVKTQLPYALTCAALSFVSYIIAGFIRSAVLCLLIGLVIELLTLFIIKTIDSKKA